MIIINTSTGWNMGDDLIREGVVELLGLRGATMLFIDRHILKGGKRIHQESKMLPSVEEMAEQASLLVVAGTPEWCGGGVAPLYAACAKRSVPTYIVGVGRTGSPGQLLRLKDNIAKATARDDAALEFIRKQGIECERFLDPAFYAPRPKCEKQVDLVVCYRAAGGNGVYSSQLDDYWRRFADMHKPDIVTVHEPQEISRARAIFGKEKVFFSSEWHAFMPIYVSAKRVFSGRIHGAVPSLASGATTWIVYDRPKVECLSTVAAIEGSALTMLSYGDEIPEALPEVDPKPTLRFIKDQGWHHAEYLREPR